VRVLRVLSHLGTAGTERQCVEVLEETARRREELDLTMDLATFCAPPYHHVLAPPRGVRWRRIDRPWTPGGALQAAAELAAMAPEYDCVHAFLWPGFWVAALARLDVPWIASIHNTAQPAGPLGLKRALDRLALRGARRVVFNSEAGRHCLAEALGVPAARAAVIPNGKPAAMVTAGPRSGIVCVARRAGGKRQDLLLAGWRRIDGPGRPRLIFVGRGAEATQLGVTAGDAGVECRGELADALPVIAQAEILALPTTHEGLPNVILEAWSAGTPVLASRVPGVTELVRDGVDGLLVDNSPEAWEAALVRFHADNELRQRLASAGRERVTRDFGIGAAAVRWAEIYREAVASP
jgi:glycosyltransferase involved in cell wall biosynthesis